MSELTQELKLKFQSYDQEKLNEAFFEECMNGHLYVVRYLLTSPELKAHADIHAKNDLGFRWACEEGHLEVVRYLLTSPELTEHADIHADKDVGFRWACNNGHLELVRYLLTSLELTEHADIHAEDDCGFRWACDEGHLDIVRYLLTSPELTDHVDIHANDYFGFQLACQKRKLDIVQYLLSFGDDMYIDFQKTDYDLEWAISEKHHNIVKAMILSLYKNDRFAYIESLPKIEKYCLEHGLDFTSWQGEMMKEDGDVHYQTTELFV